MYSILNSGAPLDSSHCTKKYCRFWPEICSAILRKSTVLTDCQPYFSVKLDISLLKLSLPITLRSMFSTAAPLPAVSAQYSGE